MSDNDQIAVKTETPVLTATPIAIEKIKGLLAEKELPDHGLRVFVAGAGCAGLQYGMMLEGNPRDSDTVVKIDGIKLIVDPASLPYMQGASIDFVETPQGGGFSIDNPNVAQSCASSGCNGCG